MSNSMVVGFVGMRIPETTIGDKVRDR
jgi:hypothetical protein